MSTERFTTVRRTTTEYRVGNGAAVTAVAWTRADDALVPVVTEPDVWAAHGTAVTAALRPAAPLVLTMNGEADKNLPTVERFLETLGDQGVRRRARILGFGGGACCDMAGLLSLLYMRGMDYALLPTSLMAQVDASIGGKVGCNSRERKNLVGGFHHPVMVVADPAFLVTLPERHLTAGLAEVVKLDVILPALGLGELVDRFARGDDAVLEELVRRCQTGKLTLLDDDPYEVDLNRSLNLGHAVAHALEKMPDCLLVHGEAVAIGLAATARYARTLGHCSPARLESIIGRLRAARLPTVVRADAEQELTRRIAEIADHRGGRMRLVVPGDESPVHILASTDVELLVKCVLVEPDAEAP